MIKKDENDNNEKLPVEATPRSSWAMAGDHVVRSTADFPEDERESLRWFFYHCH